MRKILLSFVALLLCTASILAQQKTHQIVFDFTKSDTASFSMIVRQTRNIMNITGNVISGQVTGDTSKQLSERFGKIMQDRASFSINNADTSINKSKQLESAIPASKIASLSSGEFVGTVADDPDCKIDLKAFHCEILNDHVLLKEEQKAYKEIPLIRKVDNTIVQRNYLQIKRDVQDIIQSEIERMLNDPALTHLIIKKNGT